MVGFVSKWLLSIPIRNSKVIVSWLKIDVKQSFEDGKQMKIREGDEAFSISPDDPSVVRS